MSSFSTANPSSRETITEYEDAEGASPLANVPFSDLHASFASALNSSDEGKLSSMLAVDCRLMEKMGGAGMQGKEAVSAKLAEVSAKMKGLIQNADAPCVEMRDGRTTRTLLKLKKGMISLSVGLSLAWYGGLAAGVVLEKSASTKFIDDNTEASLPPLSESGEGGDDVR